MRFLTTRSRRLFGALSVACLALCVVASNALAVYEAQDYSQAETGVVAELKAALEKFWVPLVIIMAVPLGIRLFKRLVR